MRTLSAALLAKQTATKRVPAVRVLINGVDYSNRVTFVEHHEEPYRDYATINLDNSDRGLDAVSTADTNLLGYRFRIAYGYDTGNNIAEPLGDGSTREYVESADLWVKSQQPISSEGLLEVQLYCEGQWAYLREQRVVAAGNTVEVMNPDEVTDDPLFSNTFERTKTPYELIEAVIEDAMGWTLNAFSGVQDGIINSFRPVLTVESLPYAAAFLRDKLIVMTKCYLRAKANLIWELVFPQTSDSVDETYNSDSAHYFLSYVEKINEVIPNRIIIFANDPNGLYEATGVWPEPIMVGDSGAYTGNYVEVIEAHLAATIISQADADNRANAINTRYRAELLGGYLIVYHDARVELYDRVRINDRRT